MATVRAAHRSSDARLLDRNGETLAALRIAAGPRRLDWVAIERLSPALRSALIASEDKRFYEHSGVDWRALAGAMWDNLKRGVEGRRPRGASTLSMQLAGMLDESLRLRGATRTLEQKWDQALAARELERRWTKAEILEAYLNLATFRGELVGVAAASQGLFGKDTDEIDGAEAAILAALLRGPNAAPQVVGQRACAVAAQLPRGTSCAAVTRLAAAALSGSQRIERPNLVPHLSRRLLDRAATAVWTTLDSNIQQGAATVLRRHLARARGALGGAVVVLDNASGDILAYVGASPEADGAADGVLALRPAAPMTLTFLYGLAFERRLLTAASVLDDSALNLAPPAGLPLAWGSEGGYRGMVSVRKALTLSLAVPALRTLGLVGTPGFQERLEQLGLERSTQANLLALTNAYRALALGGEAGPTRLTQDEASGARRPAMRREASFILADILAESLPLSADQELRGVPLWSAFRSGEAGDGRDVWSAGITESHAIGVRLGGAVPDALVDDEGLAIAPALWRDLARLLQTDSGSRAPRPPPGVASRLVRFEPPIEPPRREWFVTGTELELVGAASDPPGAAARIAFPAMDATILLAANSPGEQRIVFHVRNASPGLRWRVDGQRLEAEGGEASWIPTPGRHRVVLLSLQGAELDAVDFEVRAAAAESEPAQQQGGEQ